MIFKTGKLSLLALAGISVAVLASSAQQADAQVGVWWGPRYSYYDYPPPPRFYRPVPAYRDYDVEPAPRGYAPSAGGLSAKQVRSRLGSQGYRVAGQVKRNRGVYVADVRTPSGERQRVIVDAYYGQIVQRFPGAFGEPPRPPGRIPGRNYAARPADPEIDTDVLRPDAGPTVIPSITSPEAPARRKQTKQKQKKKPAKTIAAKPPVEPAPAPTAIPPVVKAPPTTAPSAAEQQSRQPAPFAEPPAPATTAVPPPAVVVPPPVAAVPPTQATPPVEKKSVERPPVEPAPSTAALPPAEPAPATPAPAEPESGPATATPPASEPSPVTGATPPAEKPAEPDAQPQKKAVQEPAPDRPRRKVRFIRPIDKPQAEPEGQTGGLLVPIPEAPPVVIPESALAGLPRGDKAAPAEKK